MESWDPNLVEKEINRAVDEGLKQRDHKWKLEVFFFFFPGTRERQVKGREKG